MTPLELTTAGLIIACAGFGVGYVVGLVDGTRVRGIYKENEK